jgi:hypothetical protein
MRIKFVMAWILEDTMKLLKEDGEVSVTFSCPLKKVFFIYFNADMRHRQEEDALPGTDPNTTARLLSLELANLLRVGGFDVKEELKDVSGVWNVQVSAKSKTATPTA